MRSQAHEGPVKCDHLDASLTPYKTCNKDAAFVVIRRYSGQLTIYEFCSDHYLADLLKNGEHDVKHGFISFATTPLFTEKL